MNFEAYLRKTLMANVIDHSIRARITESGDVVFYIHPMNTSGDTLDFYVQGNELAPVQNV